MESCNDQTENLMVDDFFVCLFPNALESINLLQLCYIMS